MSLDSMLDMVAAGSLIALVAVVGGMMQGAVGAYYGREGDTAQTGEEARAAAHAVAGINGMIGLAQAAASVLIWQAMT